MTSWQTRCRGVYSILSNPKNWFICLFGFASGLPFALTGRGTTFQAWLTTNDIDISTIAWLSWGGIPYTLKFLWAPLVDRYLPPFLGRRRGWILVTQIGLIVSIIGLGLSAPQSQLPLITGLVFTIAILSATQDIAVDAYRTDLLSTTERGMGISAGVLGYRLALLVSGAFSLIVADTIGWRLTFIFIALTLLPALVGLFLAPEPDSEAHPKNYREAIVDPLVALFARRGFLLMLAMIVFYKLGDAFASALMTPFLLKGVGFALDDIGYINKTLGLIALIFGAFLGGVLMARITLYRALVIFGVLQAVSNLVFYALAVVGKSYPLFICAIAIENVCGGLGTTAFLAFLTSLCDKRYSATQYALLSAFAALGANLIGPLAGYAIRELGWADFYLLTVVIAIPGILFVAALKKPLLDHESAEKAKARNNKETPLDEKLPFPEKP